MANMVFVSRSIGAASGGGIGSHLLAKIDLFAETDNVTVIATDASDALLAEWFATKPNVRISTIRDPGDEHASEFFNPQHRWSALVHDRLKELFTVEDAPDLIEFVDYLAEATVTIQARRTADPLLANCAVVVNICTTTEFCDVLNGSVPDEIPALALYEMERYCLANADWLVHTSGDVYESYERYYGSENLAPSREIGYVIPFAAQAFPHIERADDDLRMVFIARLERRKGIHKLVQALANSPLQGWRLTVVGSDTPTGPLRSSMRNLLEQDSFTEPRIEIRDAVEPSEVPRLISEHDVLISPSLWECGPNIGLEALASNRPLLATPVGGQVAMALESVCGMQSGGTSSSDLHALVERAVNERARLRSMIESKAPVKRFKQLCDGELAMRAYRELMAASGTNSPSQDPGGQPQVSVVIPYFNLPEFIEATVESAVNQTYENVEILVVCDGSFEPADAILDRIAAENPVRVLTTLNRGLSAARNFGVRQTSGEYILMLDADNLLMPEYIERTVAALEAESDIAFASSWFECVSETGEPVAGHDATHPMSNAGELNDRNNLAGDAVALFRRSIFESGFWYDEMLNGFEDWSFYRNLRDAGRHCQMVPEYLFKYRIRRQSKLRDVAMPNSSQLYAELTAADRSQRMQWTPN